MRRAALLFFVGLSLALAGCKGKCRQLSEKLCDCALNSVEKDSCLRVASSEESRIKITEADEVTCEGLLPRCDCHTIDTPEGKRNCGLAR